MIRLPQLSGKELIKILEQYGYRVIRQKGSHIRLYPDSSSKKKLTIPDHKVIAKGLLRRILRDSDMSVDDLRHKQ